MNVKIAKMDNFMVVNQIGERKLCMQTLVFILKDIFGLDRKMNRRKFADVCVMTTFKDTLLYTWWYHISVVVKKTEVSKIPPGVFLSLLTS